MARWLSSSSSIGSCFPCPCTRWPTGWVGRRWLLFSVFPRRNSIACPERSLRDDRLGRTLDALAPHLEAIWLEIVAVALLKADIDLSLIFYDLTAFIAHGRYAASEQVDFGFAHNTPMNKRKFKLGLNVTAGGNLPWLYNLLPGQTADQSMVASNMNNLAAWLQKRGYRLRETMIVGDRAMLNTEIAIAYEQHDLRYLTGLRCTKKEHKALLTQWGSEQFDKFPLEAGSAPQYWGRGVLVTFTDEEEHTVTHKGLVVLSGPMRDQQLHHSRQVQLEALDQELGQLRKRIGQPRYRTVKARCRDAQIGHLMAVTVYETAAGVVNLYWQIDQEALYQAEQKGGRYLLVTNDWSLTHQEMFALYRQKEGV